MSTSIKWKLSSWVLVTLLILASIPFNISQVVASDCVVIQQVGFDQPPPFNEGASIKFGATIANQCSSLQTFMVQCFIDGQLWDSGSIPIGGGQSITIWADNYWTATAGSHTLTITADDSSLSRSFTVDSNGTPPPSPDRANVKFIATVIVAPSPVDIVALVNQVIQDPTGTLKANTTKVAIDAHGYYESNSKIDWPLQSNDIVEVYGYTGGYNPNGVWIGVGELPYYLVKVASPADKPDLTFQQIGFDKPGPYEEGDVITFGATVVNQGNAAAANFQVLVYIDGQLNDSGPISLGAGESFTLLSENPWRVERGHHCMQWIVDPDNRIEESNENNNEKERCFDVEEPELRKYKLTIRTSGCGDTDPSPGTYTYDEGDIVDIKAFPCTDWEFDHWGGDASGTSSSTSITMNADKSVTAYFTEKEPEKNKYKLIIGISGCGNTNPGTGTHYYNEGDSITIDTYPCSGWEFDHWNGTDSTDGQKATVFMESDRTITAYFEESEPEKQKYKLTINVNGWGHTIPEKGTHYYDSGDRVLINPNPVNTAWYFDHWSGADETEGEYAIVFMNSDRTVTAYFKEKENNVLDHDPTLLIHGFDTDLDPRPNNWRTWDDLSTDFISQCGWIDGGVITYNWWDNIIFWKKLEVADFYKIQLTSSDLSYKKQAKEIKSAVDKIYKTTKRPVILIGHSMGGLSARAYLEYYGSDSKVSGLITICTPHNGSYLAYVPLFCTVAIPLKKFNIFRLQVGSPDLVQLNDQIHTMPLDIPYVNIISEIDNPEIYLKNIIQNLRVTSDEDLNTIVEYIFEEAEKAYNPYKEAASIGIIKRSDGVVPLVSQMLKYAALRTNNEEENIRWINTATISNVILEVSHGDANKQSSVIIPIIEDMISSTNHSE